jgi:hypothetical protein
MGSEITGEQMQAKITAARRDAEGLKDKIKRRKDELLDTSREYFPVLVSHLLVCECRHVFACVVICENRVSSVRRTGCEDCKI